MFSLGTLAEPQPTDPVELLAYQMKNGKLVPAGNYVYDPRTSALRDEAGNHFAVSLDPAGASFRVLAGGSLTVRSKVKDATVLIDGKNVGKVPFQTTLRPGEYTVQLREGKRIIGQTRIVIAAGQSVTVEPGS